MATVAARDTNQTHFTETLLEDSDQYVSFGID